LSGGFIVSDPPSRPDLAAVPISQRIHVSHTESTDAKAGPSNSFRVGALGTPGLVLLVLACVAPMGAVVSIVPIGMLLGNGPGFVGAVVVAGIVLLCFAAGYVAMCRHVVNAGAFYAYIAKGLGKPLGVASAFVAMLAYNAAFWGLAGGVGYFATTTFAGIGVKLPWQVWSAVAIGVVAFLGRRAIDVSAKVLGVALILEVAVIVVLDAGVIAHRGLAAFPVAETLSPNAIGAGSIGLALLWACNMFVGFEATAIFSEETKDATRTVARATYVSVVLIAVFYATAALILVGAVGPANLLAAMNDDPGTFVFHIAEQFVGGWLADVMQVLVLTSLFAALLGIHNAAARYFFALGREGLLPRRLGIVHPRWNSPAAASAVQIILAVIVVGAFGAVDADPLLTLNTSTSGIATVGILILQVAVAVSVIAYFRRRDDRTLWSTTIAPAIAAVALGAVVVLAVANYGVLTGSPSPIINSIPWVLPVIIVAGLGYGLWLRRSRPDVYAGIAEGSHVEPSTSTDQRTEVN
jgi:amino acid transporter